ncbi:MFS transporter [Streptomyces lanatus]|uniref:MFS transporter n=1 Tax=Streptomyces lanatus TaxID=66900 RepID=A0ABV1XHW7_9ACTN|nr:MFS transporter [Streptomyces lanatus]GHG93778.1 MFS transporter [Streptomyces lanatus]
MTDETEVARRGAGMGSTSEELAEKREARAFRWKFFLIYLAGLFAATSMGKMTPISVALREDLSLSLAQVALLTSLVTAVAAALGLFVSYLIRPLPPHRMLVAGLVVMGLAGLFCARTDSFGAMLGGRLVESVGYVVVVIVAPVLLFSLGDGKRLTGALAIWGTFMPVGLALGSFAGGVLSAWLDWRGWLTVAAGATLVVALLTTRLPAVPGTREDARPSGEGRSAAVRRLGRPLALGAGFATISGSIVATVTLYPPYLHEEFGLSTESAGTLTGVVSLAGVAGGFLASWLLVRGAGVKYLFVVALLMPAGAFAAFAGTGGLGVSVGSALVVALANELVVATVFAAVPLAVRATADLGAANGLVAQFGSVGALAMPPLVGLAVTAADGWWAVGPCLLAVCVAGLVLLQIAVRQPSYENRRVKEAA